MYDIFRKRLRSLPCLGLFLLCGTASAQNLVPNPSFEHTAICKMPSGKSRLSDDFCWWEANGYASADLYSACNETAPRNGHGYQVPKHGRNYLGLIIACRGLSLYTERVEAQLIRPLQKGHRYVVSYNVSLVDKSLASSSAIQLGFSRKKLDGQWLYSRLFVRKVLSVPPAQSTDTAGWQRITCVYTAKGNERFVNLGNFRSRLNKKLKPAHGFEDARYGGAYYLFDDVSVIEIPENYGTRDGNAVQEFRFPAKGDSLALGCAFVPDAAAIDPAMLPELDRLAEYLRSRPFVTGRMAFDAACGFTGQRREKTFLRREIALERYFENKGVSSNRLQYSWTDGLTAAGTSFTVAEVIYP